MFLQRRGDLCIGLGTRPQLRLFFILGTGPRLGGSHGIARSQQCRFQRFTLARLGLRTQPRSHTSQLIRRHALARQALEFHFGSRAGLGLTTRLQFSCNALFGVPLGIEFSGNPRLRHLHGKVVELRPRISQFGRFTLGAR